MNTHRHLRRMPACAGNGPRPGQPLFRRFFRLLVAGTAAVAPAAGLAFDLVVTNAALETAADGKQALFRFDVRWDHSWRRSWTDRTGNAENWDAAWVFVKIRTPQGEWRHAILGTTGAQAPAGGVIQVASDGGGAFVYRAAAGEGQADFRNARLTWDCARQGLAVTDATEVRVIGLEMVYVPQGPFYLGSGGSENGCFHKVPSASLPYRLQRPWEITSEAAIAMADKPGALTRSPASDSGHGDESGEREGLIPEAFPKGFRAFYCMKHELSQGEYAAFLNLLPREQATRHYVCMNGGWGHNISGEHPDYRAVAPNRACNFLSWSDIAAYADWAGLRPITEFEYEKACRGAALPIPNEYAWGNTLICPWAYTLTNRNMATELVLNPATHPVGNAAYGTTAGWHLGSPMRCGLFMASIPNATREEAGAGFYGVLDMSGNQYDALITVAHEAGRAFTGLHGDGNLTKDGNADVQSWPDAKASGTGTRGGGWTSGPKGLKISDRSLTGRAAASRGWNGGWRGVRTAPEK